MSSEVGKAAMGVGWSPEEVMDNIPLKSPEKS